MTVTAAPDEMSHEEAPVAEASDETSHEGEPVAVDWSELAVEAEAEPDDEIDLSALAAMEEVPSELESSDDEPLANGTERVRPHWLSMARSGSGE
jgi:hypothetical protein